MANTPVAQRRIKVGEKFGIKKSHAKKSIILSYKDDLLTSGRKTLFGMDFKSGNTMKMSTGVSGGGKRAKVSKEEVVMSSSSPSPRHTYYIYIYIYTHQCRSQPWAGFRKASC